MLFNDQLYYVTVLDLYLIICFKPMEGLLPRPSTLLSKDMFVTLMCISSAEEMSSHGKLVFCYQDL